MKLTSTLDGVALIIELVELVDMDGASRLLDAGIGSRLTEIEDARGSRLVKLVSISASGVVEETTDVTGVAVVAHTKFPLESVGEQ